MSAISYIPDQPSAKVHASLQRSLAVMDDAHQCAVLWFGEIMSRSLYRDLGHSSINQYAIQELGFSKSRTDDFIRLARQLENLPAVREAVASGELGYTKARELVSVATPETQDTWLKVAKGTRKELVNEVKKAKRAAKVDPAQGELLPSSPPVVAPRELPVCFRMNLTPEQEARRSALVERLHKLGGVPTDRAELMLEALAALLETKELQGGKCPRGHFSSRPPVQIHVHENAETGRMTVQADAGERELSRAETERMRCDAAVCEHGGRNTTTIPPRVRREVLARDKHRCQAPGCGRTRFLEIHHKVARSRGGSNKVENLVTFCASCHRLWHERGGGSVVEVSAGAPVETPTQARDSAP
jgi:5-methylcytosine-specific restriction endonuclease McrA